jgi:cobalt-zinc-cadmium efflux system membrane fusion protein
MKMKTYINRIVALLWACAAMACSTEVKTKQEEDVVSNVVKLSDAQMKEAAIKTGSIEKRALSDVIACNGVLDVPPQNMVSVSLPIGGILKSSDMLQGMKVYKGQVLGVFEHPDYIQMQQEYLQGKANLVFVENEYRRQEKLSKEEVNSQKTLQKAKAEYESLKVEVASLRKKLEQLGIPVKQIERDSLAGSVYLTSPINGYITKINAGIGKFVQPNEAVFEVVNTEHLHVELTVYEKDVTLVKEGQMIHFTLPNEGNILRNATVYLIAKVIDPSDRTVRIHGHLEKEDPSLVPGMYVKAEIETVLHETDALPEISLIQTGEKQFIFIEIAANTFKLVEVKTGVRQDGFVQVYLPSTVLPSAKIVVEGAYDLYSALMNTSEE